MLEIQDLQEIYLQDIMYRSNNACFDVVFMYTELRVAHRFRNVRHNFIGIKKGKKIVAVSFVCVLFWTQIKRLC